MLRLLRINELPYAIHISGTHIRTQSRNPKGRIRMTKIPNYQKAE